MTEEHDRAEWALAQVTAQLRQIGGEGLAADAAVEATSYANLFHPWDGRGDEPPDRLGARLDILTHRLERAHSETS